MRLSVHLAVYQNVHAIGDRANSIVLDVFESALDGINVTALRPRLEHAQIIRHADMTRLAEMGGVYPMCSFKTCIDIDTMLVIASVQPTHATDDMHFAEQRLVSAFSAYLSLII